MTLEPIPVSLQAPNQIEAVRKAMREHPEINTKDETQRGKILDYACAALGPSVWGRKSRNPQGTDLNTDGLTFKRTDGLFEIYDVISGSDGSATWDGFGPFKPGENGYWVPALPVNQTPVPKPDPSPVVIDGDSLKAEIKALLYALARMEERIVALEQKPAPVLTLPKLRVKGSTSRVLYHGHTIDLEVVQG